MKTYNYETLQETLYYDELENGLKVLLLPKQGFSKTYGLFTTNFGSVDTQFVPNGENEVIKAPDGVAHFLEHKMFDTKKGDAQELFAQLSASTNAFTSATHTAYLFNTTKNVYKCIELLLDFVQEECLSDASIEKEKGIIIQEIGMYDDDPDWQCYFGSILNLYHNHPVKVDIAGTSESVRSINKEILEKCYRTFYHPSNMMLFVVGNIDPSKAMDIIVSNQNKKHYGKAPEIIRKSVYEPESIVCDYAVKKMDVTMPKVMVSIKMNDIPDDSKAKLKREMAMNLLLDILFSKSSDLYEDWLEEGLINDSFSASYTQERDYCFLQIGGDSYQPDVLKDRIIDLFTHIHDYKIDEASFNRNKKKNLGMMIQLFNSPENIANLFTRYYFEGIMAFSLIDCINDLTIDDIYELYDLFEKDKMSTFIVKKE